MARGFRYRVASITGTAALTVVALLVANLPVLQALVTALPVLARLSAVTMAPQVLSIAVGTVLIVHLLALAPLFKPQPRRILDTIALTQKRVVLAAFALATIGYFDYTYRLPRTTLVVLAGLLLVVLPAWFVTIRRRRADNGDRSVIIAGDDPGRIASIAWVTDAVEGYVSPNRVQTSEPTRTITADGGRRVNEDGGGAVDRLGGLCRLDEVIVDRDVDVAILAFARSDRGEFFGALETCYEHGVTAKVHGDHAESVLTTGHEGHSLARVRLHPLDWQDHLIKRGFDIAFAAVGLLVFLPVMVCIAVAIWLDDPGPVFYQQERTSSLGQTFTVTKFRTMQVGAASETPAEDDAIDRITRAGRVLRLTHLDEIPQLWSILVGEMSVVGPRAAWTDEEARLESNVPQWRQRWFIKPGLTGLAQINEASSTEPRRKLRYDVEYIRRQSFWFDCRIVLRQIWAVLQDLLTLVRSWNPSRPT